MIWQSNILRSVLTENVLVGSLSLEQTEHLRNKTEKEEKKNNRKANCNGLQTWKY